MQRPLQITFRGMEPSEAVEDHIRRMATKLERFDEEIIGCHVVVEAPHRHQHKGQLYEVKLDIRVPNGELIVTREHHDRHAHEDAHVAVRDAFNAAVRQLEDHVRRRRHRVKRHEVPAHGRVTKLFPIEGYGFLETPDELEIYFHENSVTAGAFSALEIGDQVRFERADSESEKGPQATTVTPVGKHHIVGDGGS